MIRAPLVFLIALIALQPASAGERVGRTASSGPATFRLLGPIVHADTQGLALGIDVNLKRGWKIYWRSPGPYGVAPTFDLRASRNIASATVLWPVPKRFSIGGDAGLELIGYASRVTFPVLIRAQAPERAIDFDVSIDFGVCLDVCIPGTVRLSSQIGVPVRRDVEALRSALNQVPRIADTPLRNLETGSGKLTGVFSLPPDLAPNDVLVEVDGRLVTERAAVFASGERTYNFSIRLPEEPARNASVRVTILGAGSALELKGELAR